MISRIILSQVASYKAAASLETERPVNLIYGLNGTGKSTLSDYLYDRADARFADCKIQGLTADEEILVYNQRFIRDYFFQPDNLRGIFTLSKENKEAEEKVRNAEKEIEKLDKEKAAKTEEKIRFESESVAKKQDAVETTWKIKQDFFGGDRVLEYCLERLGRKELLFNHLSGIVKSSQKPSKSTDQLKKEVEAVQGDEAQKYDPLSRLSFSANEIEIAEIFRKQIIGNENSTVAALIKQLANSDWVKQGLSYLPENHNHDGDFCPFCQERTITAELRGKISEFFDESYEKDILKLKESSSKYESASAGIQRKELYESNPFIKSRKNEFENLYISATGLIEKNRLLILEKIKSPSHAISLQDSSSATQNLNQFIDDINKAIEDHNAKIDNKQETLDRIKDEFWSIMRWEYDQTLSNYDAAKSRSEQQIAEISKEIKKIEEKISKQKTIIVEEQKKTVNIEASIQNINNNLLELGIDSFKIAKYKDTLYQLERVGLTGDTFQTLSEGEKMIISFLYFIELCKGKKDATSTANKKIIVIDDPISSLSHIYVFNVGRLIKNEFFGKKESGNWTYPYEQVFILTHSLYFFYEITEIKHQERKDTQKLFRLYKNNDGSNFSDLKYEEIQNDYQAYWYIIKDQAQPKALIANSMRNIIEYFFNFVEKTDLNNFFLNQEMQDTRFQAFYRYINRESHSLGQNIFDFKEFDYVDFKDAFQTLFKVTGYEDHYRKMMGRSA